jgi:carbon starvation protein CstA
LFPIPAHCIPRLIAGDPAKTWDIFLLAYCFVASTTPVWILLQPRDYLSSYLLYASVLAGFFGILCGGFAVHYPAFNAWYAPQLGALFPILFITVACGACSGFHAVVASGTSSKQLDRESDARLVGYGAMLIEGLVAVIALATVIMLPRDDALVGKPPLLIYTRLEDHLRLSHNRGMEDGVRSTNEEFQLDIERRIRRAWEEFSGDKLEVQGNLQQRLDQTIDCLRQSIGDDRLRSVEFPLM